MKRSVNGALIGAALTCASPALGQTGAVGGPTFRAYEKQTGEVVAEITLPANPTGSPMSYMHDGKQYICVAAATLESPAELIALALP